MNTTLSTHYGADRAGLVYGFAFDATGSGRVLESADAERCLRQCRDGGGGFLWLHFDGAHAATRSWLARNLDLPREFLEELGSTARSTRVEQIHDGLIAVLNDVVFDLKSERTVRTATLWACITPSLLISVRHRPLRSVDRLRSAVAGGERMASPPSLLIHLLRDQADVLGHIVRLTTEEVDRLEDSFLGSRLPSRAQLGTLRRDLVRLQRLLAPEPGALLRLLNRPPAWLSPEEQQDFRQSSEEFSVALRDLSGLQERIKLLQEEVIAHVTERTNQTVFVLTAVTVIALPINLTAGLFGMNVGGIPFNQHASGFWIIVILLVLVTFVAARLILRLRLRSD